jgi:molybdopterin guanine dinucleotide-containing S/N-oxide reductase-like protein
MGSSNEKTFTSMAGDFVGGTPVFVDVKDDRIVRVRPIIFEEGEAKPWSITAGNKVFTPRKRTNPAPFDLSLRRRTYNPQRVKYPMKRISYEPGGKCSTENRGKGEFVRISWDEAMDIAVAELKRMRETYGNSSILTIQGGHESTGMYQVHALTRRVMNYWGGQTPMPRNPDSWEGWYWGAEHVWGMDVSNGVGEECDLLEDTMQNSELSIFWAYDPAQSGMWCSQDAEEWLLWLKELGKKMIFITPELNFSGGTRADKWIPIKPGTDAALCAAIAYVWIIEGTYEKEYVYSHGVGFDKWKAYVMGDEDGIAKTTEWAEEITGVSAPVIRALAREWAKKRTHLCIRYGGSCRTPYGTEWCRMIVYLQTMQGLGKAGVNIHPIQNAAPIDVKIKVPDKMCPLWGVTRYQETAQVQVNIYNPVKQALFQTRLPDGILNPPVSWYGGLIWGPADSQFVKKVYPMPRHSEIHMIWSDTVSNIANWNNTHKWAEAYRSPKIETFVTQAMFLENDALFADIILPSCTQLEREDIGYTGTPWRGWRGSDYSNFVLVYMKQCIKPLYESKSEWDIACMLAKRLGVYYEFTEGGKTIQEWIKQCFYLTSAAEHITFEEFKEKGYYVFKFPDNWERRPGFRRFYESGTGLTSPSSKIEFFSQALADAFPDDQERPPVARYIAEGETHQESLSCERAKKYPLLVESPHPRYRFHSQHETVSWLREIPAHKMKLADDYYWECVWINRDDAKARGVKHGDVVRIFNERGSVWYAAYVTERIMPGTIRAPNGSEYRPFKIGDIYRGLPINAISPINTISKNVAGMAVTAFLAQVEKWEGKLQ